MDLSVVSLPDSPEGRLRAVENKIKWLEESTHTMKVYWNTLVPISRLLSSEILSIIFSLLPFEALDLDAPILPSPVSRVCHRWREISLNLPSLWSHINFTKLTSAGTAVMLVRAKTAPLYLKAETIQWNKEKFKAFKEQIEAHIHHIRHLSITAERKHLRMFAQLASSAPSLEFLSIDNRDLCYVVTIPDNFLGGIAPKLTHLRLYNCGIRWQSPLLKGLRDLEVSGFPTSGRSAFIVWLHALKQMPRLERLALPHGIPCNTVVPSDGLKLTVDLPSLAELSISASVSDCTVVLAHLVLPALTKLCVNARDGHVLSGQTNLFQCVAQHAHGPQDTEALQSLFIEDNKIRTDVVAWTLPRQDSDDGLCSPFDFPDRTRPTRLEFSFLKQYPGMMDIWQYNILLTALPLDSIVSLTVKGHSPLGKQDWLNYASKWHKLERVRLSCDTVPAFRGMLEDAAVLGHSLLPSLEELILVNISLSAPKVYYLRDMLIECVGLGIPLETLDLRTCTVTASNRAVRLLSEIVVDVRGPVKKESGDLNQRRRGGTGVLGGRNEEPGDVMPNFGGSWYDEVDEPYAMVEVNDGGDDEEDGNGDGDGDDDDD